MCNSMCAGAGAIGRHQSSSKQSLRIDTSPAGGRKCGRGRRLYDCLRGAPGGLSRSTRIMRLPCSGGEPVFTLLLLLLRGGVVVFAGGPGCFTIDLGKAEKAVSFFEKRAHIRICRLALRDQSVPCANNCNSVHMLKCRPEKDRNAQVLSDAAVPAVCGGRDAPNGILGGHA